SSRRRWWRWSSTRHPRTSRASSMRIPRSRRRCTRLRSASTSATCTSSPHAPAPVSRGRIGSPRMNERHPMPLAATVPEAGAEASAWLRRYAQRHVIVLDSAQEQALAHFERLYEDLLGLARMDSWLVRLLARRRIVRGLYLWGEVGRGKSFLMDAFFACAPLA